MNFDHYKTVMQEYINHFELINNEEHNEMSKWSAFKHFQDNFDIEAEDFAAMFKNAIKDAAWLIDNDTVFPTNGIVYFAEMPETKERVRAMFRSLYEDDGGDLNVREAKLWKFVDDFNTMHDEYLEGKWKFKQEFRYALLYLTIRFPDENYLYKATQAHPFANCIEYERNLGSGRNFSLKNYYHMCDGIVDKIKEYPELEELQKGRITSDMYADSNYHLLAFNIIYSAVTYKLFANIDIKKPRKLTASERAEIARLDKINEQIIDAEAKLSDLLEIYDAIESLSVVGMKIEHKDYGTGVVIEQNGTFVQIKFSEKTVKFQFPTAFKVGRLVLENSAIADYFSTLFDLEKEKKKQEEYIKSLKSSL